MTTEPIAVDVPKALAGLAGLKPGPTPPTPKPGDIADPAKPADGNAPAPGKRTFIGWVAASVTKKQLKIGAAALCSLIAGVSALIATMHRNFDEVHRSHFPALEMASINVRLAHTINLKAAFAVESVSAARAAALGDDLRQELDSLEFNLKSSRGVSGGEFLSVNYELVKLLRVGKLAEARGLVNGEVYRKASEGFTNAIGDTTEK